MSINDDTDANDQIINLNFYHNSGHYAITKMGVISN
jgi:hypothetical protein